MSIIHPVFLRPVNKNKVIFLTVITAEVVGLSADSEDHFVIAQTSCNALTGGKPTMQLKSQLIPSSRYVEDAGKVCGYPLESTRGEGITGVLRNPYWSIHEVQTVEDVLGG